MIAEQYCSEVSNVRGAGLCLVSNLLSTVPHLPFSPPSGRFGQFLKWKRWVKGGMPEKTA